MLLSNNNTTYVLTQVLGIITFLGQGPFRDGLIDMVRINNGGLYNKVYGIARVTYPKPGGYYVNLSFNTGKTSLYFNYPNNDNTSYIISRLSSPIVITDNDVVILTTVDNFLTNYYYEMMIQLFSANQ
jgi:hypothetical protein